MEAFYNDSQTTEEILIDGRDYDYLPSEARWWLTIRAVTNTAGCDGNDGSMQIFHTTSYPDVIPLHIHTDGWRIDIVNGTSLQLTIVQVI